MHDYITALYHFCADFHGGQWSREYHVMCLAAQYCERWFGEAPTLDVKLTANQKKIYARLVGKYANVT